MPLAVSPNPRLPERGGGRSCDHALGGCSASLLQRPRAAAQAFCATLFCCLDPVPGGRWICPLMSLPTTPPARLRWLPLGFFISENVSREMRRAGKLGVMNQCTWWRSKTTNPPSVTMHDVHDTNVFWILTRSLAVKALDTTCFMRWKVKNRCQFSHQATHTPSSARGSLVAPTPQGFLRLRADTLSGAT